MIFGGISESGGQKRKESAIAIENGLVHVVSREELRRIARKSPKLVVKMNSLITTRKLRIEDRLVELLFRSVEQRFAKMLINLLEDFGTSHKNGHLLNIALTHQDYADLIASTRETVTNVMNRLRKNGVVDYRGKNLIIHSLDKLNDIAR
jgi:CRP-like cAMP-binding protein